jgi:hypothetical protein
MVPREDAKMTFRSSFVIPPAVGVALPPAAMPGVIAIVVSVLSCNVNG